MDKNSDHLVLGFFIIERMMIGNEYLSHIEMNNLQNCTLDGKFLTISDSDEEGVIWLGKYWNVHMYFVSS